MPVEILMPELGESVHEGTVSRWLKQEGDFVKEDEPVVEIMTDKVNTELGAPASGVLKKILIPEGGTVEVFKAMGIIEEGAAQDASKPVEKAPPVQEQTSQPAAVVSAPVERKAELEVPSISGEKRWYTPVVRSIAKQQGLSETDLERIQGTGEGGRVTKKDIEAFISAGPTAASAPARESTSAPTLVASSGEAVPLTGMRKMIAEAMIRSAAVPTVSTVCQCDVTSMVTFREANKEAFQKQYGVKLTYTPFFIKALAESLIEFPQVNSSLSPDLKLTSFSGVHIGVAVSLGAKGDEGLIVPVIRDCDKKTMIDIARDLEAIAKAARSNSLKPADVQGGTFTLTNPGTYGALFGTPMINAPQGGILGVYSITKSPVIVNDMIAIRSIMHLVLTYDHRLIDGSLAGKFLASVRDRLQSFDFFK